MNIGKFDYYHKQVMLHFAAIKSTPMYSVFLIFVFAISLFSFQILILY